VSAVDDLIASRKGSSPEAAGGSAVDALIASRKSGGGSTSENVFLAKGKQVGTSVGKALDAQRWAAAKLATGESDTDKQMTKEREMVGTQGAYEALGKVPGVGHFLQGTSDVIQQTVTDPLTYETLGAGPALRAIKIGADGLPLAEHIAQGAMKAINATPYGRKLYDFTHWGGEVAREQGPETVQFIRGAANKASSAGMRVQQHLERRFDAVTKPLSDEEKVQVGQALNGESKAEDLAPKLQSAYRQLRTLTELDYKMRTNVTRSILFNSLTKGLPQEQKSALMAALRSGKAPAGDLEPYYSRIQRELEEQMPRRENYLPTKHEKAPEAPEGTEAKTINAAEHFDPRTLEREQVKVERPEQLSEGFGAMASNAGRQAQVGVIHDSLGELLDDPKVSKLFEKTLKATGGKATDLDKIKDHWKALVGYPRAATVSLTPRHAANILDLLANTVGPDKAPQVLKETMSLATELMKAKGVIPGVKADPKKYVALTKEGRDLGAISGEFVERTPFFQKFPTWVPGVGGKSTGPLGAWTRTNNAIVWAIDEAAKISYARAIAASGEATGLRAGGLASSRLVDYSHVSPMIEKLRYVAPFGTFRGSIPGAVAGGVARNPARAAFLNRASGGTMYGGKPDRKQHGIELLNPTADVSRGLDAPQDYLRSTIGAPVQAVATLGAEAMTGNPLASIKETGQEIAAIPGQVAKGQFSKIGTEPKQSPYAKAVAERAARYLNYQNPIDLRWLIGAASAGVLEARAALQQLGMSQFQAPKGTPQERLGKEAAQQVLGISAR
jgi:hypothetical protein